MVLKSIKYPCIFFFVFLNLSFTHAQLEMYMGKKITNEMLSQTKYPDDSSVHAMVISDIGELDLILNQGNGNYVTLKKKVRIKIFDKIGFHHSDQEFYLYNQSCNYSGLKGTTYNLINGKIVEKGINKELIEKEKFEKTFKVIKFTFPDVKEGSIIEFEYTLNLNYIPSWYFQREIPVLISSLLVGVPEFYRIKTIASGSLEINTKNMEDSDYNLYYAGKSLSFLKHNTLYSAKGIPKYMEEPYSLSEENYLARIKFLLTSLTFPNQPVQDLSETWAKINENLLEDPEFGLHLNKSSRVLGDLGKIFKEKYSDSLERANAIFDFTKQNILCNGEMGRYLSKNIKSIFEDKTASITEINFFLIKLLNEADLISTPIIVSSREAPLPNEVLPDLSPFKAVVVLFKNNGKDYILDASNDHNNFGYFSTAFLNCKGRTVEENGGKWISLEVKENSVQSCSFQLELDNNGNYFGTASLALKGYNAFYFRNALTNNSDTTAAKTYLSELFDQINISNITIENYDSTRLPIKISFELSSKSSFEKNGDFLFFPLVFLDPQVKNPFSASTRVNPIYFDYPKEENMILNIKFPANVSLDEIPKNSNLILQDQSMKYSVNAGVNEKNLQISSKYIRKKCVFSTENEYFEIKEFFNKMMAKQKEQIVLKVSE